MHYNDPSSLIQAPMELYMDKMLLHIHILKIENSSRMLLPVSKKMKRKEKLQST